MSGMSGFQMGGFQTGQEAAGVPLFDKNGTTLSPKEREAIAKRRGICVRCGIKTHTVGVFRKPLTNDHVYKGHCIKDDPTGVPADILQQWEARNPRPAAVTRALQRVALPHPPRPSSGSLPPPPPPQIGEKARGSRSVRPVPGSGVGEESFHESVDMTGGSFSNLRGRQAAFLVQEDYTGGVSSPDEVDINGLLSTLQADRSDNDMLKACLHRIRNFGFGDVSDPKAAMGELISIMEQYRNDARVMALACGAVWKLTADDRKLKIQAQENGTIEAIVDALRKEQNQEDTEFIQWAVGCLASFAVEPENKRFIARIGGIESVVDVLKSHPDSPGVLEWTSRILHNMISQREGDNDSSELINRNVGSIEEANGISILISSMKQHSNEAITERWAMKLLWQLQARDDEMASVRILKKMKDDGFVNACVKIFKARTTESVPDLFRLCSELLCNVLIVSELSDIAYREASECLATAVRILKDNSHPVKLESCARLIGTLASGTIFSQTLLAEASGLQAVLDAVEKNPDNVALLQTAVYTCWPMSCDEQHADDILLGRAARVFKGAVDSQTQDLSGLYQAICGLSANLCLVQTINPDDIPVSVVVMALQSASDSATMMEAERAITNYCSTFPDDVDSIVDSLNVQNLPSVLTSPAGLTPGFCDVLASVTSKSEAARLRVASPEIVEAILGKMRDSSDNVAMCKCYMELLATLVVSSKRKSTKLPEEAVQIILRLLDAHARNHEMQWIACVLLRNILFSTSSPPNVTGLVHTMISLVEDPSTKNDLKVQACSVLWMLTGKYTKQDPSALSTMSRSMISVLVQYKGDELPFDYDLLAMAAGTLASVTNCMIINPTEISSEDVDEIISVPYAALDFEAVRTDLYVRILDSIYNLSYVSDAILIQCGVIVVVIDTMAEFEQCLEIQQFGCAILAVLASTENLQVNLSIVQTDGIDMIINALALFCDDPIVQSQACKALSHLSIDEESRMLIASLGGLMLLGNTMKANMDNLDLLEGALSAVLSLSADADVELLTESNVVAVTVEVMRRHVDCAQIQEFGMGVLQNISMRSFDSKQSIADSGGIYAVTDCIKEFMGSPAVLERAFTTLWSLAVLDQNQALIAQADGINLVVNGMMTAITYEGVQKQGCGCLCTLSSDSQNKGIIQNVGGVDSIVYAMWAHYGSEEIQVEACRALSSLAVDAQTNEVMIAGDGEINAIISAMRRFPHSERLQEHACVALRNFLLSADNVMIIKSNEEEVRSLVSDAGARFPETCSERAGQIMQSLSQG